MKKAVKYTLFVVAAILIIFAGFGIFYSYPILSMNPAETGQIPNTNIFAVKNRVNTVYFIKTGGGYIMIDAGSDRKRLEASLKAEGIDANDVRWIFLTHSDGDHTAALTLFPNAQIHISEDELPLINGTAKRSLFGGNALPSGIDIAEIAFLYDGLELPLNGTTVECIKAPGHTSGSMLYLVDGKYLFSGDAFKVHRGAIGVHPFTMDAKQSRKTMEQLKDRIDGSSIVLTAHYGYHEDLRNP